MSELARATVEDALDAAYRGVTAVADDHGAADLMMLPSRCAGWTAADVLFHQLLDARRALRTFASPATDPPDVDDITYWRAYEPGTPGNPEALEHARYVRIGASAYPPGTLAWEWRETAAAACRAARACPYPAVTTQGHVLSTADFIATLTVEAAVHYLDLTVGVPSQARRTPPRSRWCAAFLTGCSGAPCPAAGTTGPTP